jgi:thioredoxin-related protein
MKQTSTALLMRLCLSVALTVSAVGLEAQKINWMKFGDAVAAAQKKPRKILIDVYTDWCGWCKVMDNKTFTDTTVINAVNSEYYAVKLNAESYETVEFKNRKFKYSELAAALLGGQMSYPHLVFLDENTDLLSRIPGYQKPEHLAPILSFLGGDHYKTTDWNTYLKTYNDLKAAEQAAATTVSSEKASKPKKAKKKSK